MDYRAACLAARKFLLEELDQLHLFFGRDLNATLFGGENVSVLFEWDGLLAINDEAVQYDREELLQRRLNRALDGQALRVKDLEAALQDQIYKFFG